MGSDNPPFALKWRSNTIFIIATVAVGLFTDLFLYGLIVPVLPFMLQDRVDIPEDKVQSYVSGLLAAYAGASVCFSIPAGWVADRTNARRTPFLTGLLALLAATIMLAFGQSVAVLVLARVLQGISAAVVWTVVSFIHKTCRLLSSAGSGRPVQSKFRKLISSRGLPWF